MMHRALVSLDDAQGIGQLGWCTEHWSLRMMQRALVS